MSFIVMICVTLSAQISSASCNHPSSSLIDAIISIESNHNTYAIGDDGRSVGCLQIRPETVLDINRFANTNYTLNDRYSKKKSIEMFVLYVRHYAKPIRIGRKPTNKDYARIWNGGPNGHTKKATLTYWNKVCCILNNRS